MFIAKTKYYTEVRATLVKADGTIEELGVIAKTPLTLYQRIKMEVLKWMYQKF